MPDDGPASIPSSQVTDWLAVNARRQQALLNARMATVSLAWTGLTLDMGHPLPHFLARPFAPPRTPEEEAEGQVAERRAFALLEAAIGVDAAAKVAAGGGYEIPSRRMSGRLKRRSYLVPREGRVKILEEGLPVGESCLLSDETTPWPDQVLHKIKAIQADETVVFATGNVTMYMWRQ